MYSLQSYLIVSVALFSLGMLCMLIRRNLIHILMGIELIFNAAALNFAAFDRFTLNIKVPYAGQTSSLFIIVIAAAEAAVALAILLSVVRSHKTIFVDELKELKG